MAHEAVINFIFNSKEALRELSSFSDKFTGTIERLSNSSIAKFGRIGAVLGSIFSVKGFYDHTKAIGDLATLYDHLPIEQISKFSNEMELLGSTDEEAVHTLENLEKKLTELRKGGNWSGLLNYWNIGPLKENGQMKSSIEIFQQVVDKVRELKKEGESIDSGSLNDMFSEIGLDRRGIISFRRLIEMSDEELEEFNKRVREMGTDTKETYNNFTRLQRAFSDFRIRVRNVGNALSKTFLPDLVEGINKLLDKFIQLDTTTQNWIIGGMGLLVFLPQIIGLFKGLSAVLGLLYAHPIIFLLGTIIALATNLGGCRDKLDELHKSFDDWINSIRKDHPYLATFFDFLSGAIEGILHPIETVKKAWSDLKKKFGFGDDGDIDIKEEKKIKKSISLNNAHIPVFTPIERGGGIERNTFGLSPTYNINVYGNMDEQLVDRLTNKTNTNLKNIAGQLGGAYVKGGV